MSDKKCGEAVGLKRKSSGVTPGLVAIYGGLGSIISCFFIKEWFDRFVLEHFNIPFLDLFGLILLGLSYFIYLTIVPSGIAMIIGIVMLKEVKKWHGVMLIILALLSFNIIGFVFLLIGGIQAIRQANNQAFEKLRTGM